MEAFTLRWHTIPGGKIMKGHDMKIGVGDRITVSWKAKESGTFTLASGQVTGIAQSYLNPDQLRVLIAGLDQWIDLEGKTVKVETE